MQPSNRESFLKLVRLGIGYDTCDIPDVTDWSEIDILASGQGLSAIVADGIDRLPDNKRPPKELLLQWVGRVMQVEAKGVIQWKAAGDMALLFHHNNIKTYVLKGAVIAECYPHPEHRACSDLDCFLLPITDDFDAWEKGNQLMEMAGFEVDRSYYKNSGIYLPGLIVENHMYMVPFRGNKILKKLEITLQELLLADKGTNRFQDTYLLKPPSLVTALFIVEHSYSHFLSEGLTWKHVLDWVLFKKKNELDIDWFRFDRMIDEYGFRKFYDSFFQLGRLLVGDIDETNLGQLDKKMLKDIWAPLDLHESLHGMKAKFELAGNTWRARWKYSSFTNFTWIRALLIQVTGFLFIKRPSL